MLTSFHTNSNSLNLELSRFHTFQLSQTLSIPYFLSHRFMANPSGTTVNQSSMGENLEMVKILETNHCPKTWVHFDLCLTTNGSKRRVVVIVKSFLGVTQTRRWISILINHASLFFRVRIRLKRILTRKLIFSFTITKHYENSLYLKYIYNTYIITTLQIQTLIINWNNWLQQGNIKKEH